TQISQEDRDYGPGLVVCPHVPRTCASPAALLERVFPMPLALKLTLSLARYTHGKQCRASTTAFEAPVRVLALTWRCCAAQYRLCFLQVGGVKAPGEPAIDRCEQLAGCIALALALPQPAQAYSGLQLQGLGLLAASNGQCLLKTARY